MIIKQKMNAYYSIEIHDCLTSEHFRNFLPVKLNAEKLNAAFQLLERKIGFLCQRQR